MELKNVEIIDEARYIGHFFPSPDYASGENGFYKRFPRYRTIEAIQETLDKIPMKITSEKPITFVAREYLHPKIKERRLLWMPLKKRYEYIHGWHPWEIKEHINFERLEDRIKEKIINERGDRTFEVGLIECMIELSDFNAFRSASINCDAMEKGFIPIRAYNEL